MKRLSIIIVSFENKDVLDGCLASIERFNDIGEALEVIVVEQSPDESIYKRLIEEYPEVTVIRNDNRGFGAGNNVGASYASGELLLFLNPDTIFVEPLFQRALEIYHSNNKLGMFGFRLIDSSGKRNRSFHFRRPYGLFRAVAWRLCDLLNVYFPKSMYVAGADMFVPKDIFFQVNGFDEKMFMYFEETYLCDRLNNSGYTTAFFSDRRIIHLEGQSSTNINTFNRQLESLKVVCRANGSSYTKYLLRMRRDRLVKALFPSKKADAQSEIGMIDAAIENARA